jgi:hypothetical protein
MNKQKKKKKKEREKCCNGTRAGHLVEQRVKHNKWVKVNHEYQVCVLNSKSDSGIKSKCGMLSGCH